ncbi:MAG: TetR/AcrR family transcriptional regulator [Chloroflexi bacterium]|nr:MAG: TetR/AcrR family transcriptional regulator [Chloroflexota bacterium]
MPKAFTEYEKDLIGARLLDQGYKLFSAYGLKKTGVGELAAAAGISKGAFYNFYESKEALFMDVVELAEQRFRQDVLAAIDLPGPSPRARLSAVLKKAFTTFKAIPILQILTSSDYDLLRRRVSPARLQEHLASDRTFIEELVARCRQAGIPIQASAEEIGGLFYALVLTVLHEEDLGPNALGGAVDRLLELVAAFCLGEVQLQGLMGGGEPT